MDHFEDYPDQPVTPSLGGVVETDRGSLPFSLIHGEALVACASWALGDAGVTAVDLGTEWAGLVDSGEPFVLHDPLCPMTPASFIAACVARAVETGTVVVGVRPVTDTVKSVRDGAVGATVDRDGLRAVASPIVLPAAGGGLARTACRPPTSRCSSSGSAAPTRSSSSTRRPRPAGSPTADDLRLLEELTRPASA